MGNRMQYFEAFLETDANELNTTVQRETIQQGRTFSKEALDDLHDQMIAFVGAALKRRWDKTGEPPTHMEITLKVDVG
jgi:hypothetical protein